MAWSTVASAGMTANGAFRYEKRGAATGRTLVFLPALGFAGSIWDPVIAKFEKEHPIYVLSFAGSDGIPAIKSPVIPPSVEDLHKLVEAEKIDKPIIVGQLFGGQVGMHYAAAYPDEIGGLFAIPMLYPRAPRETRTQEAQKIADEYANMGDDMWEPNMRQQLTDSIEKPALVNTLMPMLLKCDRAAYARALGEILADTIEDDLSKIKVPVFLLAPVELPAKSRDADVAQMRLGEHSRTTVTIMRGLYNNLAKVETMALRNAKLFPMVDQPDRVTFVLDRYLKKLGDPESRWGTTVGESLPSDKPPIDEKDENKPKAPK
ncbi:MAG: alpha/beta hydrolase [Phycisphaerae bacterium]